VVLDDWIPASVMEHDPMQMATSRVTTSTPTATNHASLISQECGKQVS